MEKNNENTNYHPEINQKSKEIVYKKSENTDPYERLYSDAIVIHILIKEQKNK